jgi:HEAT repeat protein
MRHQPKFYFVVAAVLVAFTVVLVSVPPSEPRYQGHSLTYWLTICWNYPPTRTPGQVAQAEAAVRKIGTNALPCLLKWIASEVPPLEYRVMAKLPAPGKVKQLLYGLIYKRDKPTPYTLARIGFQLLGENSAPAVPELTKMLNDSNSLLRRQNAAVALASIGTNGLPPLLYALSNSNYPMPNTVVAVVPLISNVSPVIPLLINCTTNSDRTLAGTAVQALGRLQMEPDIIVPAITNALAHPDGSVRFIAAQCFVTWLDGETYRAVPSLKNLLNDPDYGVRSMASNLLTKIQTRPEGSDSAR